MALVVESTSTASTSNADSLTITKPTGVQVGDLLILVASGSNQGLPSCSGFTVGVEKFQDNSGGLIDTGLSLLWRVADSTDVAASNYTVNNTGTTTSGAASMLRVSGWTSGNPMYQSASTGSSVDAASYTVSATGLSLSRPYPQLLIAAVMHQGDASNANYSNYTITSSDSNPSWTELQDVDFEIANGINGTCTLAVAYALSSNTSNITGYSIDATSSTAGDPDAYASVLAVIVEPAAATGTNALLEVTQDVTFPNTAVEVGTTGTNTLLEIEPELFDQSGSATAPTQWTNETKGSTTWINETK